MVVARIIIAPPIENAALNAAARKLPVTNTIKTQSGGILCGHCSQRCVQRFEHQVGLSLA